MNEWFAVKHDDLLAEFERYIVDHPELLAQIPNEALIVFIDPADPEFNRFNLERVERYRAVDDIPDRPIVYLDVGELAPIHSRMLNPRILTKIPDMAIA
jgi:hypothetical protein